MEEAINLINKLNIYENDIVVLACSYGPDSMVLLDLLQKLHLNIVVAHVNHKLRKESDKEEKLLKEFCLKNSVIFESLSIDEFPKGNTEMNARNIRYNFFDKIVKKYEAKYLLTAHHGDDLIETVLMRLTRGTIFGGYAGFKTITQKGHYYLIRPLIFYTKQDIMTYAEANNILYAVDQTNNEDNYTRNRIRHNILPEFKKENSNIHKKILKFSELITEYDDYFNRETNILFQKLYHDNQIDLNEFYLLDGLFKKRLLEKILGLIYKKNINLVSDIHIALIIDLIDSQKPNGYVILPKNIKVSKFYNALIFDYHEEDEESYDYILNSQVSIKAGKIIKTDASEEGTTNDVIRLNSSEIKLPLHVRSRKKGDRIEVKNMLGTKKVNEIFIDNKISIAERINYPVVADNEDIILWIPGLKKSKLDKQKDETYDIILKYEKGEKNEK